MGRYIEGCTAITNELGEWILVKDGDDGKKID